MHSVTEEVAGFIVRTDFNQIPEEVIRIGKRGVLDCLGVALAGSTTNAGKLMMEFATKIGGEAKSTIIGGGIKTSPVNAALANGVMAHVLDYDDIIPGIPGHPSAPLLPVLLAVGECRALSGKRILEAYVLGFEIQEKLSSVIIHKHYRKGWHSTATIGTMGAAVAAAKLLHLDKEKVRMTLGIAASQAGGLRENFGTMTKPFHVGNAARGGVTAALLAEMGFTANKDIFEGRFGFCNVFCGEGEYNLDDFTESLGKPFGLMSPGVGVKKYPCGYIMHPAIDAVLFLTDRHGISVDDIAEVTCEGPPLFKNMLLSHTPTTEDEAKFSMEYCVAISLLDRRVGLAQFTLEKVRNPEARELMRKVKFQIHPELKDRKDASFAFSVVTIKLKDGQTYSHKVDRPKGAPITTLSNGELFDKYEDCARLRLSGEEIQRTIDMLENLEKIEDITQLTDIVRKKEINT